MTSSVVGWVARLVVALQVHQLKSFYLIHLCIGVRYPYKFTLPAKINRRESTMQDLLETLRHAGAWKPDNDFMQERVVPRIGPKFGSDSAIEKLNPKLRDRLTALGVARLYAHQAEAIELARQGRNIVLDSPTASGKTLAFALPILQSLLRSRGGHALFVYPMNAVATDQLRQLQTICDGLIDASGDPIRVAKYVGDTRKGERKLIRDNPPHLLLTNVEMLHLSFLGSHKSWSRDLWNLNWVVLDEMHVYRGFFGTNSSIVLRRLGHMLALLGANPQFALASATCANPLEHSKNLTGREFTRIASGSEMRPERRYVFIEPEVPQRRYWSELIERSVNAALGIGSAGKSCLVFCPTRDFAEKCYVTANERITKLRSARQTKLLKREVDVYKSGITVKKREAILDGLNSGKKKVVFTTNALEVGIDIRGLDVVIMVGFPDNVMRARQQLGRAGRGWDTNGAVVYFPRNAPMDSFYAHNLDAFLTNPSDELVIYPENPEISQKHASSLLHETEGEIHAPGSPLTDTILDQASKIIQEGRRIVHRGRYWPHKRVQIRGASGETYDLMCDDESLGKISGYEKFRVGYLNAVYIQSGERYRVVGHTTEANEESGELANVVKLVRERDRVSTVPYLRQDLRIWDNYDGVSWRIGEDTLEVWYGLVGINEWIDKVDEDSSEQILGTWHPEQSSWSSNGHATWFHLPSSMNDPIALHSLEQIIRVGVRFVIPVDEHDVKTHTDSFGNSVYLVETYPGGIGIAKKSFDTWRDVLEAGIDIASECGCRRRCPYCLLPPRGAGDIDKHLGIELAWTLLSIGSKPVSDRYDKETDEWAPAI